MRIPKKVRGAVPCLKLTQGLLLMLAFDVINDIETFDINAFC